MQAITFPMYRSFRGWSGCMPPARGDSADTVYQRSAWAARSPDFGEGRRGRSGRESAPIDIATCSHGLVQSAQGAPIAAAGRRSEEHTSELQSLMRISYAVFCM